MTKQEIINHFKQTDCEGCAFRKECHWLFDATFRKGDAIDLCNVLLGDKNENECLKAR